MVVLLIAVLQGAWPLRETDRMSHALPRDHGHAAETFFFFFFCARVPPPASRRSSRPFFCFNAQADDVKAKNAKYPVIVYSKTYCPVR